MAPRTKKSTMTDQHKAALAEGRNESRAVRNYLEAIEATKPKRGRQRSQEAMEQRLAAVEEELPTADPLKRLNLIQERMDLSTALAATEDGYDLEALEKAFIAAAAGYSSRKGITYSAWRELGVQPSVLKAAGVGR
jgi:hypothetical protein